MKTTSYLALAAAAGLFAGGLAITPAKAADLGGDCCADLEERVAELEATTVRKGNRVVSVELYGQVNKLLLFWDDGIDSDVYVTDSDMSSTRFGLRGSASLKPGWTAGYRIEVQMESATSIGVSQDEGNLDGIDGTDPFPGDDAGTDISVRRTSVYVESAQFGRVTMGKTSIATDDMVYTYLGAVNVLGAEFVGGGLRVRTSASSNGYFGSLVNDGDGVTQDNDDDTAPVDDGTLPTTFPANAVGDYAGTLILSSIATDTDIGRRDAVRYDTPSIYGFIFSAGWGESDEWDVGVRFKKEWNSIQVVAAAGYHEQDDVVGDTNVDKGIHVDQNRWILAGGIKHTPSGIFLNGVYVEQETEDLGSSSDTQIADAVSAGRLDDDEVATYYSIFGGIEKNWTGYGLTSLFGRYTAYEDFGVGQVTGDFSLSGCNLVDLACANTNDVMTSSEVNVWGFGIEQNFDSAAMEVYTHFNYFEIDNFNYYSTGEEDASSIDGKTTGVEDIWTAYVGTRIKF
jgi:hypothetical protein